jgi:hypothetical protein
MNLVTVNVKLGENDQDPEQHLDDVSPVIGWASLNSFAWQERVEIMLHGNTTDGTGRAYHQASDTPV